MIIRTLSNTLLLHVVVSAEQAELLARIDGKFVPFSLLRIGHDQAPQ